MKNYPLFIFVISTLMLSMLSHSAWAFSSPLDEKASQPTNILLLGDSISASYGMKPKQGWVHLLNQQLAQQNRGYKIINASVSGETTSGGLSRLAGILATEKVDHLMIELGGNDGLRGYSPKLIKNNLLQMITIAQEKNLKVSMIKIKITPNYGPRYNKMFEQVFEDVAKEKNIQLLPFFMEEIAVDSKLMQADGIHPNALAQPIIAKFMAKQLAQLQ